MQINPSYWTSMTTFNESNLWIKQKQE